PGPWVIAEAVEPALEEPPAPLADGAPADADPGGGLIVAEAVGGGQDDPGAGGQGLGRGGAAGPGLQGAAVVVGDGQRVRRATDSAHGRPPFPRAYHDMHDRASLLADF